MKTSGSSGRCWCPELLSNPDGTPRSPMTPGVMFDTYGTPDGVRVVRPDNSIPTFTPCYAEQYLFIGPVTPGTPWTPRRTPRSPQTPKILTSNQLYQEHYYWYWLLDPLFNYDNEEQETIEQIRIDAMSIAYGVISKTGKLEEYENEAKSGDVSKPNKMFLDEVFKVLIEKYKKDPREHTKLDIVRQIIGGCAYAAASGEVKVTDSPSVSVPVMNEYDDSVSSDRSNRSDRSELDGGFTRRRVKTIKKYKKRTRRRISKRKSRKTRTTRRKH